MRNVRRRARALRYEAADIGRTVGGGRAREPLERCSRELLKNDTPSTGISERDTLTRYSRDTLKILSRDILHRAL